jgi:membrane-associated phospholipid phosphatase
MGDAVPHTYQAGMGLSGNLVAAMPSVHLGVTTLMLLALWRTPLRWASGAYLVAMSFAVVYTGDHYVVDVLAGMALGAAGWMMMRPRGQAGGPRID